MFQSLLPVFILHASLIILSQTEETMDNSEGIFSSWKIVFASKFSLRRKWSDDYFLSNVEIRLVKRTWFPGPTPSNTDTVLDQAPYEVEEAAQLLRNGPLFEYDSRLLKEAHNLFDSPGYDPGKESIFVINTVSQGGHENFIKTTVMALAMRNIHVHYNVFTVHLGGLDPFMIVTIKRVLLGLRNQYSDLGNIIAGFIRKGIDAGKIKPNQIHLIGFCFSSQLAGYIARALPGKIKSILALDPFTIGMWRISMTHLSKDDAMYVHAFHGNSIHQGTTRRIATADFTFNKGFLQPGCWTTKPCSHEHTVFHFWYMILFSDLFIARQCSSYLFFKMCLCEKKPTIRITYPPNTEASGKYSIATTAHHPYGLKENGATCWRKKMKPL